MVGEKELVMFNNTGGTTSDGNRVLQQRLN